MRVIALALAAAAPLLLAQSASAQCPIQDIALSPFGEGAGLFPDNPPVWKLGFDKANCAIEYKIDAFACCNTFVSQNFVAVGTAPLDAPLPLAPPFVQKAQLFVQLDAIFGPGVGTGGTIPLPPNKNLVGQTVFVQSAVVYFTTIGMTIDVGVTPAFKLLLL
jgi:hypothetical protein